MIKLRTWEELAKWAGVSLTDLIGDSYEAELLKNDPLHDCIMLDELTRDMPELLPLIPKRLCLRNRTLSLA